MNLSKLKISANQIAGNNEGIGIVLGSAPGYGYDEKGNRTDVQTHTKYITAFVDNYYEKVTVKVPGTQEVINKELLAQHNGKVKVKFKNLTGKIYRKNDGEYDISCSAESVEVLP